MGEEGRLFVRGGEAYETKTFMDGMLIHTPYFSKTPDLPEQQIFTIKKNSQFKVKLTNYTSKKITTKMGVDYIYYDYNQEI